MCVGYRNIIRSNGNFCSEGRETPLSPPPPSSSSVQTSPRGLGYTCGPIDGSLYAVVHQGAAGGARGSPLTVSMDSGISSAPPQRPSPPEPEPDNQAHGDLDKLLHDMMLTVEVSSLRRSNFPTFFTFRTLEDKNNPGKSFFTREKFRVKISFPFSSLVSRRTNESC